MCSYWCDARFGPIRLVHSLLMQLNAHSHTLAKQPQHSKTQYRFTTPRIACMRTASHTFTKRDQENRLQNPIHTDKRSEREHGRVLCIITLLNSLLCIDLTGPCCLHLCAADLQHEHPVTIIGLLPVQASMSHMDAYAIVAASQKMCTAKQQHTAPQECPYDKQERASAPSSLSKKHWLMLVLYAGLFCIFTYDT